MFLNAALLCWDSPWALALWKEAAEKRCSCSEQGPWWWLCHWWCHHLHPQSFSWAAWRAVLGGQRGQLEGSCCPWEHRCAVAVLQHPAGVGMRTTSSTAGENRLMVQRRNASGISSCLRNSVEVLSLLTGLFSSGFGVCSAGWCWFVW